MGGKLSKRIPSSSVSTTWCQPPAVAMGPPDAGDMEETEHRKPTDIEPQAERTSAHQDSAMQAATFAEVEEAWERARAMEVSGTCFRLKSKNSRNIGTPKIMMARAWGFGHLYGAQV